MPDLKTRFERFMAGLEGAENIDDLMKHSRLPGRLRADYLAFDRDVIIEQKSLEVDLDGKIQTFVADFFRTQGIAHPDKISFRTFVETISQYPDTGALRKRILQIVTQRIDDILAKADKQTRDTRETFVIPNAVGIVVILNDDVQIIEPDFVTVKAFDMLRKLEPSGELRYPHNQVVISISEAHRIPSEDAEQIPTETIFSDRGNRLLMANQCSVILQQRWAQFNGALHVESPDLTRTTVTRDPQKLFRAG
jgi:hypothetical protein